MMAKQHIYRFNIFAD